MKGNKSLILLSGGLDSAVSLAVAKEQYNIELALFFDYGQRSFKKEKIATEKLCEFYNINLEIIQLDILKTLANNALVNKNDKIPEINDNNELNDKNITVTSMQKVWIPNRNGLFINIAACYADKFNFSNIIIGANAEEAQTFSDNSVCFIDAINSELEFSTLVKPKVYAPLINLNKTAIVKLGKTLNFPFQYIWSCYDDKTNHCGKCESCMRLKRGLESACLFDILNVIFESKELK